MFSKHLGENGEKTSDKLSMEGDKLTDCHNSAERVQNFQESLSNHGYNYVVLL